MGFVSDRKALEAQAAETRSLKKNLQQNKQAFNSNVHRKVTSPKTFLISFLAGCAVGWVATRPKKKSRVKHDDSSDAARTNTKKESSLAADTAMRVAGVIGSVVMAEVTKQMTDAVKTRMNQQGPVAGQKKEEL